MVFLHQRYMEVSGPLHALALYRQHIVSSACEIGGRVGCRASLDSLGKRSKSSQFQELNSYSSVMSEL
jgi:hypothetical protein